MFCRRLAGVLDRERGVLHAEEAGADALSGAADADEAGQRQFLGGQQRGSRRHPMAGYCTTGFGCRPVFINVVPRSWLPSLVTSERMIDRCLNCWRRSAGFR